MSQNKRERATFLTGPIRAAGKDFVYEGDPRRAICFVDNVLERHPDARWRVRIGCPAPKEMRESVLRSLMRRHPLWCYEEMSLLFRRRIWAIERIQRLLPVLASLSLDVGELTFTAEDRSRGISVVLCSFQDMHVYFEGRGTLRWLLKLATAAGLRVPPREYWEGVLVAPCVAEMRIEEGSLSSSDVGSKDLSLSPSQWRKSGML